MFLQAVYAGTLALPRTAFDNVNKKITYELGSWHHYETCCDPASSHVDALPRLLDVTRMASLISPWFQAEAKETELWPAARFQVPVLWQKRLRSTVAKLAFFMVFESAFFANVQVSMLGVSKAADKTHELDRITAASIIAGFASGAFTITLEYTKASQLKERIVQTKIEAEWRDFTAAQGVSEPELDRLMATYLGKSFKDDEAWAEVVKDFPQWTEWRTAVVNAQRAIVEGPVAQKTAPSTFRMLQAVVVFYLLAMGRAVMQLFGVVLCENGLFNIMGGCIDEDVIRSI